MTQFHLPQGSSGPWYISTDPLTGLIWFVEQGSNQIGSINPINSKFSEYNITTPNSTPEAITSDNSGNVWVTELGANQIGELPAKSSEMSEVKIPRGPENLACGPDGITAASDGSIWFTCEFSNQIDEFFPSNSSFHEYNLPVFFSAPIQIVFDRNGNFWFTAADSDMIGYASVSQLSNGTENGIQEFAPINRSFVTTISNPQQPSEKIVTSLSTPAQLALSSDGGSLWISEHTASSFDRYDIGSKTLVKYWTSQTHNSNYAESLPNGISIDTSGNVWIAEHYGNKIAEFDPSTEQFVEYPIPCCSGGIAGTLYLTTGPNGSVWFTEFFGNAIGVLKPAGGTTGPRLQMRIGDGRQSYHMSSASGLSAESNLTVPIVVQISDGGTVSQKLVFDISGVSDTGELHNLSAVFSPSTVSIQGSGLNGTNLVLKAQSSTLRPGIYYLTVSVKSSLDNSTYSGILKLTVSGDTTSSLLSKSLLLEALVVSGITSIIVVSSIAFVTRNRKYHRKIAKSKARPKHR
ncbi:MAG TPA: SMP-30/gluconolactonase/LRE family protein [Nitrososphaerales archaeon]|nr:SMP-30/gluconolactonase/LRE family protein [Nitrososphaerales archaeon]